MKYIIFLILFFQTSKLNFLSYSQNIDTISYVNPNFNLNTKDGLISNCVYGCLQDKNGFIYLYTNKGISKFDGHQFKNFTLTDSLPSQDVWLLSLDKKNRLWIHTHDNKLSFLNNDTISTVYEFNRKLNFLNIIEKSNNIIQFNSLYSNEPPFILKEENSTFNIIKFPSKRIPDLSIKFPYQFHKYRISLSPFNKKINFCDTLNNKLNEFNLLTDGTWYFPTIQNNTIYASSNEGLLVIDSLDNISRYFICINQSLNRSFIDQNQSIWICTKNNGVYLIPKINNRIINFISLINYNLIQSFSINNNIFLYCENGDLFLNKNNKLKKIINIQGIQNIVPWFENKFIIIGDFGLKLLVYNGVENLKIESINSIISKNLDFDSYQAKYYNKNWIIGYNYYNILKGYNKHKEKVVSRKIHQDSFRIKDISFNNNGINVFSKYNLFKYDSTFHLCNIIPLKNKNYFLPVSNTIFHSKFDQILIGTERFGIFFMSPNDSFHFIPGTEDLETKSFCTLNEWVVAHTNKGVFILKYLNNQYVIAETLTNEQGIAPEEILGVYAIDGLIRIVTKTGIHSYLPGTLPPKNYTLHITESWIGTNKITLDHLTKLKFNFEKIRLKFSLLDFEVSKDVVYQYRIQNNLPWQNLPTNQLELSEVAAGKYSLAIRAINKYTNKEFALMKIPFMVENPFWLNTGFLTFLNGLLILLFYKYYRSINKARIFAQSLLGDLSQKVKESKMKVLETQMNPHFIYNSMNSIKSYIRNKNPDTAESYLAQFSDLMRAYLDASRTSLIPMTKEMELIERYIRLERMRFSNSFDYTIDIDPEIDLDSIFMPTMVIQPFVENSIRHGLFHRRSGGELQIRLFKQNHHLIIELSDNGIGIDNSKKIQVEAGSKRRSHAMEIIKEKVNLINSLGSYKLKYTIGKLNPDSEDFPGTLTQIRIYNVV